MSLSPGHKIALTTAIGFVMAVGAIIIYGWTLNLNAEAIKNPPWPVLTALAAVPSLLLTWYWRKKDKDREIENKATENDTDRERLKLNSALDRERLLHERFESSVRLLGDKSTVVRMGGIYSLERLIKTEPGKTASWSINDHNNVVEVLAGYVRKNSRVDPFEPEVDPDIERYDPKRVTEDVQASLTVLGRRQWANFEGEVQVDLNRANLRLANFQLAKFNMALLNDADFSGANPTSRLLRAI